MNHAAMAEKAVSSRSILYSVKTAMIQLTQQMMPPISMGLKLQPMPVMNVGKPYSIKNNGMMNS